MNIYNDGKQKYLLCRLKLLVGNKRWDTAIYTINQVFIEYLTLLKFAN